MHVRAVHKIYEVGKIVHLTESKTFFLFFGVSLKL